MLLLLRHLHRQLTLFRFLLLSFKMAKTRFLQSSFVSGELSPLLKGRVDLNQYYQGVQTAKNLVIVPQGGMKRRPGTQYVQTVLNKLTRNTTTATAPNGGTASNINDDNDSTVCTTTAGISTTIRM